MNNLFNPENWLEAKFLFTLPIRRHCNLIFHFIKVKRRNKLHTTLWSLNISLSRYTLPIFHTNFFLNEISVFYTFVSFVSYTLSSLTK